VRTLQHRGSHRGHTNEEDAEAIFANDEELYEDGAISADSTFTLPVFPLGTFPMDGLCTFCWSLSFAYSPGQ
jgi:hypothetical protein